MGQGGLDEEGLKSDDIGSEGLWKQCLMPMWKQMEPKLRNQIRQFGFTYIKKKGFKLNKREQRTPLPNNNGCNNIVNCPVLKEFIIIASRVLKTRDSIETRVFKTRFTRFASPLTWKMFATWRFQTPLLIPSLSVFQTLSQSLKHSVSLSSTLNL